MVFFLDNNKLFVFFNACFFSLSFQSELGCSNTHQTFAADLWLKFYDFLAV